MARPKKAAKEREVAAAQELREIRDEALRRAHAASVQVVCECGSVNFHIYSDDGVVCAKCKAVAEARQ